MSRIAYEAWNPRGEALAIVHQANVICAEYRAQGYDLTLRQLYYQFVARAIIPNNDKSYKRLGSIVNRGRMAGLIDWNYIVDRTRNLRSISHWDTPGDVLKSAYHSFRLDKWSDQPVRIEVWVEKEALAGVIGQSADALDVPWFSCRGYVSQSELWGAGQRLGSYIADGQRVLVLHLGDHDPSGIDMTRDITDRLRLFIATDRQGYPPDSAWEGMSEFDIQSEIDRVFEEIADRLDLDPYGDVPPFEVRRIALNMDQVREFNPPPNPAKLTDSRSDDYIARFGRESWELDALDPQTLDGLISRHVLDERDDEIWDAHQAQEDDHRLLLRKMSEQWSTLRDHIDMEES
jgi:hypothetical protein